ncbi:MAG TPA: phosphate ABC transporter permease PstA, partial [Gammaproteobacteria bacterium]
MIYDLKGWFRSGTPWVWLNAAAVSASIIIVAGLLLLIAVRGMGHFWPKSIMDAQYKNDEGQLEHLIGERHDVEVVPAERLRGAGVDVPEGITEMRRLLIKVGNRDVSGTDFRWVLEPRLEQVTVPQNLMTLERREWGNFYGYLKAVKENGTAVAEGDAAWDALQTRLERVRELDEKIRTIEKGEIGSINYKLEQLRLDERRMELAREINPARLAAIEEERRQLRAHYEGLQGELQALSEANGRDSLIAGIAGGGEVEIALSKVVHAYRPNAMSLPVKMGFYVKKFWEFLTDEPREANTEGGIFPAIFGTVMMVILMSIFVTPFGVVAAVYLREYARQGPLTRIIRIAVNNLAGVPAIVYGVFGLGFFVYFLGGQIDQLFYPEALPSPTFGSGGILWSSLTLAILTVPVVIVATEEGLSRIPKSIREGSLALGATKAETLWRTVLPMASPAMMTGLILAIARAAGEVAPLMLVG